MVLLLNGNSSILWKPEFTSTTKSFFLIEITKKQPLFTK